MSDAQLPSFARPPVVETVLGLQFDPIPNFSNGHLGIFWASLRAQGPKWSELDDQWSTAEDAQALAPAIERFGSKRSWSLPSLAFSIAPDPTVRLQIHNAGRDRMIQVQNGRIHLNWLSHEGTAYPRYGVVRTQFDRLCALWIGFLAEHGLGNLRPNQWEVTYVNHIPSGELWRQMTDWGDVLPGLLGRSAEQSGVQLETHSGGWTFEISPERGRLHVEVRHARAGSNDGPEVIRLTLTARGPAVDLASFGCGLDLGRETIVQTFTRLTSERAHAYWGRQS